MAAGAETAGGGVVGTAGAVGVVLLTAAAVAAAATAVVAATAATVVAVFALSGGVFAAVGALGCSSGGAGLISGLAAGVLFRRKAATCSGDSCFTCGALISREATLLGSVVRVPIKSATARLAVSRPTKSHFIMMILLLPYMLIQ